MMFVLDKTGVSLTQKPATLTTFILVAIPYARVSLLLCNILRNVILLNVFLMQSNEVQKTWEMICSIYRVVTLQKLPSLCF